MGGAGDDFRPHTLYTHVELRPSYGVVRNVLIILLCLLFSEGFPPCVSSSSNSSVVNKTHDERHFIDLYPKCEVLLDDGLEY